MPPRTDSSNTACIAPKSAGRALRSAGRGKRMIFAQMAMHYFRTLGMEQVSQLSLLLNCDSFRGGVRFLLWWWADDQPKWPDGITASSSPFGDPSARSDYESDFVARVPLSATPRAQLAPSSAWTTHSEHQQGNHVPVKQEARLH